MTLPEPPLLVITDRRLARASLADTAAAVFAGGCRWLMVREKDLGDDALRRLVDRITVIAEGRGATVLVNGNAAVAAACGAGVHLPQGHDPRAARATVGKDALIGVSAHSPAEIAAAREAGADYATLSPVFASVSKPGYGPALGLDGLASIIAGADLPVVALGGIEPTNAASCLAAGAAGVAVLGAVMTAADPRRVVASLIARMQSADCAHRP